MRLVAGVLALTLFAPLVRAEDPRAPQPLPPVTVAPEATQGKVPFRVVRVMPESRQALLFDRRRATHVLAEVGAAIEGYTVEAIDGDEVTLRFEGTRIVLAAPARSDRRRREDRDERSRSVASRPAETRADPAPTSPAPPAPPAPIDPYSEPAIRTVRAPDAALGPDAAAGNAIQPGEGGVRVISAPGLLVGPAEAGTEAADAYAGAAPGGGPFPADAYAGAAPGGGPFPVDAYADAAPGGGPFPVDAYAEAAPGGGPFPVDAYADAAPGDGRPPAAAPAASPASLAPGPAASPARAASATTGRAASISIRLARAEVDAALGDFSKLATAIRGSFSASGMVLAEVTEGSIFHRAGLRAGDTITAIDGAPLRSLDDAANLYARAAGAKSVTLEILRAGKPIALHVAIH